MMTTAKRSESVSDFFLRHTGTLPVAGKFSASRIEDVGEASSSPHVRRDFFKIMLLKTADGILNYADKKVAVTHNALVFGNPLVPYSWEGATAGVTGYIAVFNGEFIGEKLEPIAKSALFRAGGYPVLYPDESTLKLLEILFIQLMEEQKSGYQYKYEQLKSIVEIIIHKAIEISPDNDFYVHGTSLARISSLFLNLLERQFPLNSDHSNILIKTPGEYASQLAVHINHLNKALRETTGKTTSDHINERIISEAKTLLRQNDWTVAAIGYSLGFDHASNFNTFFKRHTGLTPNHFRRDTI